MHRLSAVQRVLLADTYRNRLHPALWKATREKEKPEASGTGAVASEDEVMGSTRYVYLDENAGKTAAPFMSQPLEKNFIGEEENVEQEEVECNLALEKMKLLQQEQEELDAGNPDVESVSPVLSSRDMETLGEYLARKGKVGEEKSLQAARIVFSIQQSNLIDIFTSNAENAKMVDELLDRYLDEDGNPKPLPPKENENPADGWRKYI